MKIPEQMAFDVGFWVLQKIYSSQAFKRIPRTIKMIFGGRKILIIGGGEIATEIGIAAYSKGWKVRAIVAQDPARRKFPEQTPTPVNKLPWYIIPRLDKFSDFSGSCEQPQMDKFFLYVHLLDLKNLPALEKCILNEMPDVVLLEDMFLSPKEWDDLYINTQMALKETQSDKQIFFVPSPAETEYYTKDIHSEIFLSKRSMKRFLAKIGLKDHLLGNENDVVFLDELKEELRKNSESKQCKKIREYLQRHGKTIFKPENTSSGHGQLVVSDFSKLSSEEIEQSEAYQEFRVKSNCCLMEKYIGNRTETCLIRARVSKNKSECINRIYYKKYDIDKSLPTRLQGMTRLAYSETRKGKDNALWLELDEITKKIHENLHVPFIYVEFIIDNDTIGKQNKPKIYVNEISYRPDDAGFITHISHEKDQFKLFIESLEDLIKRKTPSKTEKKSEFVKLRDNYICKTMVPKKPFQLFPDRLSFDLTWVRKEKQLKLKFYEKFLGAAGDEVDYGRIIGFMFHHKSRTRQQAIELLRSYERAIGLPKETIDLLIESLPEME